MKKLTLLTLLCISFLTAKTQDMPAYKLYDAKGQPVSYARMCEAALKTDLVLFGELHNNPIAHWLQLELTRCMFATAGSKLILGAEMLEADNQEIINEYTSKLISYRNFKAEARLWNNFETDYKPLVDFARENGLTFVATNIPRRYASLVSTGGFEALQKLSAEAKKWIAPQPVPYDPNLPGYKKMMNMEGMPGKAASENFPKAQAIKDATMAHFITQYLKQGNKFIHYHGAFHSDFYDGIYWYIKQYNPKISITTISTVEQNDISTLADDYKGAADFIICVPASMTKTY